MDLCLINIRWGNDSEFPESESCSGESIYRIDLIQHRTLCITYCEDQDI